MKEQKGFTLIELLAVIVILGIIAAIAIPSVLGLIDNTKKDAHVANANQLISSAKMAIANNSSLQTGTVYISLGYLEYAKYIEEIKDPDSNTAYVTTPTEDPGTPSSTGTYGSVAPTDSSSKDYVEAVNGQITGIILDGSKRGVMSSEKGLFSLSSLTALDRTNVVNN